MEFEAMLTPREKSPLPKMSPEEDRTRDAVDSEPMHYQQAIPAPEMIWPPKYILYCFFGDVIFSGTIFAPAQC